MVQDDKVLEVTDAVAGSPEISKSDNDEFAKSTEVELPPQAVARITRLTSILNVLVAGIALFNDGYNAQIIGYLEPLFSDL
jgi:hypothetical protein